VALALPRGVETRVSGGNQGIFMGKIMVKGFLKHQIYFSWKNHR
jgi:hypothetical protein